MKRYRLTISGIVEFLFPWRDPGIVHLLSRREDGMSESVRLEQVGVAMQEMEESATGVVVTFEELK